MVIYVITNLVNGKRYVGQTTLDPPIKRWRYHVRVVERPRIRKTDLVITQAMRKYGVENFTFKIIKVLPKGATQEQLNRAECRAIKKYKSMTPNGYNIKEGGSNGHHTEKSKRKMSVAHTGVPCGPCSEETKRKMSIIRSKNQQGIIRGPYGPCSEARKLAISKAMTGVLTGPMSQAHKDAISAGHKRRKVNDES